MKKLMFVVAVSAALLSLPAFADSSCATVLAGNDSFQGLINAGSCYIDNLDFSAFSYHQTNGPSASSIVIQLVTTPGDEGFQFDPIALQATSNGTTFEDATLGFTVTGLNGASIDDLGITFNGIGNGTGGASFTESYSGPTEGGNPCNPCVFNVTNPIPVLNNNHVTFDAPVSSVTVTKDFQLQSGTNGSANISVGGNTFSNVPEPRALTLLVTALLGGVAFLRRRRVVQG